VIARRFSNMLFYLDDGRLIHRGSGRSVHLRPKAAQLLAYLLDHSGTVLPREQLVAAVWETETVVDYEAGLAALIRDLRQAIRSLGEPEDLIETVPRRGYRLAAKVRHEAGSRWMERRPWIYAGIAAAVIAMAVSGMLWLSLNSPDVVVQPSNCSLAILPFQVYGAAPSAALPEHADLLLADSLLAALLRQPIERMSLVGRTSLQPYVDRTDIAAAVAADLGVDMLIEGSVQPVGERRWRVQARLLNVPSGRVLWSEEVDIEPDQTLQAHVVTQRMAESLTDAWPAECSIH